MPIVWVQLQLHLFIAKVVFETCSDVLVSYMYNFDSNYWSAVYKHTDGKDYKFKAGYDSEVRLGWASLWVRFILLLPLHSDCYSKML